MNLLTIETYIWILSGAIFALCVMYFTLYYLRVFLKYIFTKKNQNKVNLQSEESLNSTNDENIFESESEYVNNIRSEEIFQIEDSSEIDNTQTKNKKILDHIIYEAEGFKEKNNIIDYEKKLIEGLSIQTNHLEIMKLLTDHYFETKDYKKSLSLCKKILEIEPENDKYIYFSGLCYLEQSEYETAKYLIEKAVSYKPENPKYILSLSETYYVLGDTTNSIEYMKKLIKLRPQNIEYLEIIAKIYREIDDDINYRNVLYNMLELDPLNVKIKDELARLKFIND